MSKRKAEELDKDEEGEVIVPDSTTSDTRIRSSVQNSLDSDEEDDDDDVENEETYVLKEDDIEGQEDGAAGFEGDIQLTPFNMKEEMEEGHFDAEGMYHWKKEGKVVRDNWLENIDWIKINNAKIQKDDEDSIDLPSAPPYFDTIEVYQKILPFMKPKETVAKALRRLAGNKSMTSSERWKRRKAGVNPTEQEQEAKANVTKLTELADSILQNTGNMDVYQETFEYITRKLNEAVLKSSTKAAELDMYADDFDEKEKERLVSHDANNSEDKEIKSMASEVPDIMWEFKWNKDDPKINGPHTTEQMNQWSNSDYFKGDVWVRKFGEVGVNITVATSCGVQTPFSISMNVVYPNGTLHHWILNSQCGPDLEMYWTSI